MKAPNVKQGITIAVIALFVVAFLWGRTVDAAEARLGIGFGYNANEGARYQELMVTSDSLHWYAAVTRIGADDEHDYQYTRFTGGYRVNWRRGSRFSPYLRLGAAYFDEAPTDYVSEQLAFDLAIGLRIYDLLEVEFDQHNSTGGRSKDNEGVDGFMVSMVFPFGRK